MNYSKLLLSSSRSNVKDEKVGDVQRPTVVVKHEVVNKPQKISQEKGKE